jgi:hypothetical protein
MNALSVQEDATFDLTNPRLMILRIALGSLFAVVITLPFGFDSFYDFLKGIVTNGVAPASNSSGEGKGNFVQAVLLLLPFVLGFSTSLVIQLLNRLVQGAQAFFGMTPQPAERPSTLMPQPTRPNTAAMGGSQSQPIV